MTIEELQADRDALRAVLREAVEEGLFDINDDPCPTCGAESCDESDDVVEVYVCGNPDCLGKRARELLRIIGGCDTPVRHLALVKETP